MKHPTTQLHNNIIIIINVFVQRRKVVTSEVLGPGTGSVLLRRGKKESPEDEEFL